MSASSMQHYRDQVVAVAARQTAESVRDDLPTIDVRTHAGILKGQLSGRLNAFASVTVRDQHGHARTFECAWVTIADCLNRGMAIRE